MSFILDALRKSEHERQRQAGPGIADLRPAAAPAGLPRWVLALGVLLVANIVIVTLVVWRQASTQQSESQTGTVSAPKAPATAIGGSAEPTAARSPVAGISASVFSTEGLNVPVAPAGPDVDASVENPVAALDEPVRAAAGEGDPQIVEPLPTLDELAARGRMTLPPLHLDIHVYRTGAGSRFVFINQRKYREGARLSEGPLVERITREGVVLRYGGTRFLMPRP